MAALTVGAVALYPSTNQASAEWFPRGKDDRTVISRRLVLTLTGQGGQTNTIGASALGFTTLLFCTSLFDDTNNLVYGAVVDPVLNVILLDAGNAGTPTDVTATAYIVVTGTVKVFGAA